MNGPEAFTFDDDGAIPNSRLPVLVWRAAVTADPAAVERIFAANRWPPAWRNGVYGFHHFHGNAHEALGIARGQVTVQFGGPNGQALTVKAGDVVVIPAGVAHKNAGQSDDLLIVGAYPDNAPSPNEDRGRPDERAKALRDLAAVEAPAADPVTGGAIWAV